ncbi:zinc transporter, ZIP family [Halorientalis persicus]|uniref:Zinc transporter, ZIP family n=1 Tax=Halorientalis persicus TaxID=1367881 RepID=A0A1H8VQQ9_9EURY|nr:ZIP family metal transporter [Halorientalis persicus]SEP17567.1 zinc transporter, ZIP family [Halorientalis persicus]
MSENTRHSSVGNRTVNDREWIVGAVGVVALVILSAVAMVTGVNWKLVAISWTAFAAMAVGVPLGARAVRSSHPLEPVWGYGLASGAMVTSAALFLVPQALGQHGRLGSLGIAVGFLGGYVGHTIGHRFTHLDLPVDHTATELTVHALSAGAIIGAIYTTMPSLTSILGIALISHKAPAGYAAARRLTDRGRSVFPLLLPAAAVGLVALPVGIVGFSPGSELRGLLFGVAAGVFLHVAVDLLPECTTGSETCPVDAAAHDGDLHQFQDRLRRHAALSAVLGGAAVVLAWSLVV